MYTWLRKKDQSIYLGEKYTVMLERLKDLYKKKLYPLEACYNFHEFHSQPMEENADFDSKPLVMLMGEYSTGKTTFVKFVLEKDFPGMRIGPEPTTDFFSVVMYGDHEGVIPGPALVADPKRPFQSLSKFGTVFLNKLQASVVNSPVLRHLSFIDTPGILSSTKHKADRGYDFPEIFRCLSKRVDRILLFFDGNKLDFSDEMKRCVGAIRGEEDKVRIILNKADSLNYEELMKVYGSLMWALGNLLQTPEVGRVFMGSFWDKPLKNDCNRKLFQSEENELFSDIQSLPKYAALRKLNDFIKRAREAKVHAFIIGELKKEMPLVMYKETKKQDLIANLEATYAKIQKDHRIAIGDLPNKQDMQEFLQGQEFDRFQPIKPKLFEPVTEMLEQDIPAILKTFPPEELLLLKAYPISSTHVGGLVNPFNDTHDISFDECTGGEMDWIVSRDRYRYDSIFESLDTIDGKLAASLAKEELFKTKLPNSVLAKIWKLADIDRDGMLDKDEFALAMYLAEVKVAGHELPVSLPFHLIPPNKRHQSQMFNKTSKSGFFR